MKEGTVNLCMASRLRSVAMIAALCTLLFLKATAADAQTDSNGQIGATKGQVAGVAAGIAAVGAGIGVGVYFLVRHDHTLTGCTASVANGMVLQNEGDQQRYYLVGVTENIRPGARVRVSGKRKAKNASGDRTFLVEKLSKDLGPCHAVALAP